MLTQDLIENNANGEIVGFFNHKDYDKFLRDLKKHFGYTKRVFINTTSRSGAVIIKDDGIYLGGANIAEAGTGYKISDELPETVTDFGEFLQSFEEDWGVKFKASRYELY